MFGDFVALAADQLANSAAKHHYISQGEVVGQPRRPRADGRRTRLRADAQPEPREDVLRHPRPACRRGLELRRPVRAALERGRRRPRPRPVRREQGGLRRARAAAGGRARRALLGAARAAGVYPNVRLCPAVRRPRADRDHLRPLRDARAGSRCGSCSSSARSSPTCASSRSSRRSTSTGSSRRRSPPSACVTVEEAPGEAGFGSEVARAARGGRLPRPVLADRGRGVADPGGEEPRGRRAPDRPVDPARARTAGGRKGRASPLGARLRSEMGAILVMFHYVRDPDEER